MSQYRGFNAKQLFKLSSPFHSNFLLKVFADDGEEDTTPATPVSEPKSTPITTIDFETLIANARKEEKDKLYGKIKKLEETNKALLASNNENLIKVGTIQAELDKLSGGESDKLKELTAKLEKVNADYKALKESTPKEEEIRSRIEQEYEVKLHKTTKLAEDKDKFLPIFADEITGTTKEEVDEAVKRAIEKTIAIKQQLGLVDDKGNPVNKTTPAPPVANPTIPLVGNKAIDLNEIKNLDPKSPEYAEMRKKLGLI